VLALLLVQTGLAYLVMQLDREDALMSLGDGGFVLLPLAFALVVMSLSAYQAKRWLPGLGALLVGLLGILVGSGSLYLQICCGRFA
jgi:hypothetical protein